MAGYSLATGDTLTRKQWKEREFAIEVETEAFFGRYMGNGPDSIIQRLTDLEKKKGDTITFELLMQLRGKGKRGKQVLDGYEEAAVTHPDSVSIDTLRHATMLDGQITQQRTDINIPEANKMLLRQWHVAVREEELFAQFGGRVGSQFLYLDAGHTGHAGNTIVAGSTNMTIYGGDADSESAIEETDKPALETIERFSAKVNTLVTGMLPAKVESDEWHVWVVHPYQLYWMRRNTAEGEFKSLMSDLATYEGRKSPIFKGGKFVYNGVIVVPHKKVPLFTNASGVQCAASFFLGRQAAVWARGNAGNGETALLEVKVDKDYGDKPTAAASGMWGAKKVRFDSEDFGCMSCITAAPTPDGI